MGMTQLKESTKRSEKGTADRITQAAEIEFAERGFDGTGMKAISTRAGVSQALLHYHFGNKDHLYTKVVERRSKAINDARLALLAQVDPTAPNALEAIFDALFRPPLGPAGGNQFYTRIFGGLIVGRAREQALVKQFYDPTAQRFIEVLQQTPEAMDRQTAAQAYTLGLGVLVAVIARDGRLERLMAADAPRETEEILQGLIPFAAAGARALCTDTN